MKRFSRILGFMIVFIAVMAAVCTVGYAATLGQKLPNPEEGWQRIDSDNSKIVYNGYSKAGNPGFYNGSSQDTHKGTASFYFTGTKIRLIGYCDAGDTYNVRDNNISVNIDGNTERATEYYATGGGGFLSVFYEKTNLSSGRHKITISSSGTSVDTRSVWTHFDAIDIDDTGYLVDINTPMAPANLNAAAGDKVVDLKWDAVEGAASYIVKRSETAGGPYTTTFSGITTASYQDADPNLENGKTYYYVVAAIVNGKESPNSNEASATIPLPANKLKLVLEVKGEKQLSVRDELSDNTEMDWTSSDSTIATVDANGMVKALKPGNTVITCTSKDKSYTETINVLVVDLEYQLAVDLNVGDTCRLTVDDLTNTVNVTWSSYDPKIATVSAKGKVTAVSEGLTYVIASDKDGKEIGRIYIRVRQ